VAPTSDLDVLRLVAADPHGMVGEEWLLAAVPRERHCLSRVKALLSVVMAFLTRVGAARPATA
jgi:hypothetical protein